MGAGISLAFALKHPQMVRGLVLCRPAWLEMPNPPNLSIFPLIAKLVGRLGLKEARHELEQTALYKDFRANYPATAESISGLFDRPEREALVAAFQAIPASARLDSLDDLRTLDLPSVVLANRKDPIHPFELAELLAKKLPGAHCHEFPSKSESLAEHYRQFRRLLVAFLEATT